MTIAGLSKSLLQLLCQFSHGLYISQNSFAVLDPSIVLQTLPSILYPEKQRGKLSGHPQKTIATAGDLSPIPLVLPSQGLQLTMAESQ